MVLLRAASLACLGSCAAAALAVRPVRRRELGWFEHECWGDIEFLAELAGAEARLGEPVALRLEVVNNCKACRRPIPRGSWVWVEDGRREAPYFLRSSSEFTEALGCPGRRVFSVGLRVRGEGRSVAELPVRLNISLQNDRAIDVAEGAAVVGFPFYAARSSFEVEGAHDLLLVGVPGVGKTTFIMSGISALSPVPRQLQNLGGATLEGHTTLMVTRYPLDDWTESGRIQINLWDTWGLRPQNFSVEFLEELCKGQVSHGFQMQAYERGESGAGRWAKLFSAQKMGSVLFFVRADQIKHPEGLPAMRSYLNHAKNLGKGAILVVTWLHTVPNPDGVLADLRRRLQIPVLPFTRGCHPDCSFQAPSEVPSVVSGKDPEVDKHVLVILEKALELSQAAEKVDAAASWSTWAQGKHRRLAKSLEAFCAWLQSAAWGSETVIVCSLSVVAVVAGRSRWRTLNSLELSVARVPVHRRREVVVSPLLRQLLIMVTLLYIPLLQQSLPAVEKWVVHSSTICSKGGGTSPIIQAPAEVASITDAECRAECRWHPECAAYVLSSRRGFFQQSPRCELFRHCDLQHAEGSTAFLKPVPSLAANLTKLAYVLQVVLNLFGPSWNSGRCYCLTGLLCFASVRLCWGSPPTSSPSLLLMLHLANVLVLFAMDSHLRERLASVIREESTTPQRLKDLKDKLIEYASAHGNLLRGQHAWAAQADILLGLIVLVCVMAFVGRCASGLSGTEAGPRTNVLSIITTYFVGVNSNVFMRTVVEAFGVFVFSSPIAFGLQKVRTGLGRLCEDPGADLEQAAAIIANKIFRVETMLSCLKGELRVRSEVGRVELEDMAETRLGLPSASPESSALVCAAAAYFAHARDDEAATRALEEWASMRAVGLLERHIEARHITSEMLFAPSSVDCAELAAAEAEASGRLAGAGRFLVEALKALCTGGLSLLWRQPRRPRARARAADHVAETVQRGPATAAPAREADLRSASAPREPPVAAAPPAAADHVGEALRRRPAAEAALRRPTGGHEDEDAS